MKKKETWRLIHQFDSIEVEVYDGRVAVINIGSLLSESGATSNILTLVSIKFKINSNFRKKIMSMKGMEWKKFQEALVPVGYAIWKQIKS
jgi:hypothetical protein